MAYGELHNDLLYGLWSNTKPLADDTFYMKDKLNKDLERISK